MQTQRIPVFGKGRLVAYAIVDEVDGAWAETWCWHLDKGYVRHGAMRLHREVLGLGRDDPRRGDHINGDRLDNRRANLRICTAAENNQNYSSTRGTSRYRGVHLRPTGKWRAQIGLDSGQVYLGDYESELDAARVAARWRHANMPFAVEDPELVAGAALVAPRTRYKNAA